MTYRSETGGVRLKMPSSAEARAFLQKYPALCADFEFVKGNMDDVFLSVTARTRKGAADEMLWLQTLRNLKIFVKDKANIFFALLAPLIVLGLYVLFLGKTQTDTLLDVLKGMGVTDADDDIRSLLIAGYFRE